MTEEDCAFCEGDAEGDHRVTINTSGEAAYTIRFGSLIRPGKVTQLPVNEGVEQVSSGRRVRFEAEVDNTAHVWIGFGPLQIINEGPDALRVSLDGDREEAFLVAADGVLSTSCPKARRRNAAAAAAAGGVLGVVSKGLLARS